MYSTYSAPCVSLAIASKKRMADIEGTPWKNSVSNNAGVFRKISRARVPRARSTNSPRLGGLGGLGGGRAQNLKQGKILIMEPFNVGNYSWFS